MTKYLLADYLKEIEIDDLDSVYQLEIFGDDNEWWDNREITVVEDKMWYAKRSERISINMLFDTVNSLKELGATHVEIIHHEDHRGYVFVGLNLRKANKEEIKEFEKKLADDNEKARQNEIIRLKEKLKKLEENS